MTPFSMFLGLQPVLRESWSLSNTASGWISSAYFGGYMLAVPALSSLTDRVDARAVWLGACALAAAGALGFALWADGTWTAAAMQFVAGAGLAGTYMPGLKLIADRLPGTPRPRHVAFYTTSFTMGSSLSFWIVGFLGGHMPWRLAVAITALGPSVACARHRSIASGAAHSRSCGRVPPALALGPELGRFDALRGRVRGPRVGTVRASRLACPVRDLCRGDPGVGASPVSRDARRHRRVIGVPASMAGAELIGRLPRRRVIVCVMVLSAVASLVVMPAALVSWLVVIGAVCFYSALISGDSAALTSGILDVAPVASRGTAMAVYSTLGFGAATAGTFAVGAMLDLLGGQSTLSWTLAFAMMGAPNLIAALAISKASR